MEVKASFVDLTNMDVLELDHNPNIITDTRGPEITLSMIPGTSTPKVSVGRGGSRVLSFTIRIAWTNPIDSIEIVKQKIAWLQSVTVPYASENFEQKFWTPVQFIWGDLYNIPVLIRTVNSTLLYFDYSTALPEWADVALTLEEISPETVTVPEVRDGGKGFSREYLA